MIFNIISLVIGVGSSCFFSWFFGRRYYEKSLKNIPESTIKLLCNKDLAYKIAETLIMPASPDQEKASKNAKEKNVRKDLLRELFPEAFNYVENFLRKEFSNLVNKGEVVGNFLQFCSYKSSIPFGKNLTEQRKEEIKKMKENFIFEVSKKCLS